MSILSMVSLSARVRNSMAFYAKAWTRINRKITRFLDSRAYKTIVYIVIGCYATTLILDAVQGGENHAAYRDIEFRLVLIMIFDLILRAVFVRRFNAWFWFDVAATFLAFVPGLEPTRAIRLFRLLSEIDWFRDSMEDTMTAVKWALPLLCILMLFIGVLGLMGFFGYGFPECPLVSAKCTELKDQFGTLGDAMITAFIMVMLEDLSNIYVMYDFNAIFTWVYIFATVAAGLVLVALIFAKSSDASHENDEATNNTGAANPVPVMLATAHMSPTRRRRVRNAIRRRSG